MPVSARRIFIAIMLLTVCVALVFFIQHNWVVWQQISVDLQRRLHQVMTLLLQEVGENRPRAGITLAAFSFLYGVLHALGPGHGKIIIMTYLATHPSRLRGSLAMTLAASLLQGIVAIALVTLVLGVLQLSSRLLHQSSFWLEKGSYVLVILLGAMLCLRALKQAVALRRRNAGGMRIRTLRPLEEGHVHDENCGCGHQHVPSARQTEAAVSWRTRLAVIVAMGIRPCSGAILVLLFAKVIGVYGWGVAAALAMSAGTAMTISGIALLVHAARGLAQRVAAQSGKKTSGYLPLLIILAGGIILIVAGVLLYQGAVPPGGGIRPFGRS